MKSEKGRILGNIRNNLRTKAGLSGIVRLGRTKTGQVTIATILIILAAATILIAGVALLTFNEIKKINNVVKSAESYYASEAGVEDAILRIRNNMSYTNSYTLTVGSGSTTVDITGPLEDLTITSKGDVNSRFRKVAVNLDATPSTDDISFSYGVQVGDIGLTMNSNARVIGNVFSNGPINGSSNAEITGDTFSAGPSGLIDNIDIGGDAHAHTIQDSNIGGTPYCQVESGNNKPCDTSQPDPDPGTLPISDAQINNWKNQAAAGGEISSVSLSSSETATLGPVKINGNLTMDSNSSLTVTGTIWVTGNVAFNSNSLIVLDPSFGDNSGVIVADGKIDLNSNSTVCGSAGGIVGSCNSGVDSYLMLLSTKTGSAISANSNSIASILYANNGTIELNSNAHFKEVTGYGLQINSNATVTYESGLADVNFSSGPGGTFNINSWQEVE